MRESHHRVRAVASDDHARDVAELAGSLPPATDGTDQRTVRPDHEDVIELAIEDVKVGLRIEVHRAHAAECVPSVTQDGPDGEDLLGHGAHDHVRAVQGSGGAGGRFVPGIAAGHQEE